MDSMHNWALLRLLVIALMAFPFVVAAVVAGFRERHADGSNPDAEPDDGNASLPIAGPDAWRTEGGGRLQARAGDGAMVVARRAA